jgi:hypothetical protein
MITDANTMLNALKRGTFVGLILYRGPSMLDGSPIVVIANRIVDGSTNAKTGAMVQTFIIRDDVDPLSAIADGSDDAICGDCIHRRSPVTGKRTCYVNVGRSVMSVWNAFLRGRYARPGIDYDPAILSDLFAGMFIRIGTYGDPAAAPVEVWQEVTTRASGWNGYTHQWRLFPEFRGLCMASADSATDREAANAAGWRTFRVREASEPTLPREVICPASEEAGKRTNCAACKACGGTSAKARADIVIAAHGATKKGFRAAA